MARLRSEGEFFVEEGSDGGNSNGNGGSLPPLLRHGFWTVLPVKTPSSLSSEPVSPSTASASSTAPDDAAWMHAFSGTFVLEYLPKISPGRFFGSSARYAVYADPDVLFHDLPALLRRMEDGPPVKDGATALMVSSRRRRRKGEASSSCGAGDFDTRRGGRRGGASSSCPSPRRGFGNGGGTIYPTRSHNDAVQWSAYNMVRIALRGEILGGGQTPVVDTSTFVVHALGPEDARLFRCDAYGEAAQWGASDDGAALEFIVSLHDMWSRSVAYWSGVSAWWSGGGGGGGGGQQKQGASPAATTGAPNENVGGSGAGAEQGSGGDNDDGSDEGMKNEGVKSETNRRRLSEQRRRGLPESASASNKTNGSKNKGTWMGVLSSTDVQYFTHIVPAASVGVIHLDDYPHQ